MVGESEPRPMQRRVLILSPLCLMWIGGAHMNFTDRTRLKVSLCAVARTAANPRSRSAARVFGPTREKKDDGSNPICLGTARHSSAC